MFRKYLGLPLPVVLLIAILPAVAGLTVGLLFPKFEATALLQFPEAQKTVERPGEPRPPELRAIDPKANVIELAAFKRVAASYDSAAQLAAYVNAAEMTNRPGAGRLVAKAEKLGFWEKVVTPVLPFSRRDQKEFGDIKDASATTILGLEITSDAASPDVAKDMVDLLAAYYINAVVRERVRAWTLAGKVDSQSQEKGVQADILKAELDIGLFGKRAEDMKAVLARYPEAGRMDSRQLLSVNPTEGGERYLSPLAQLVGAESAISQRREQIRRWQRDLKQKSVLAKFYNKAEALLDAELDVDKLLGALGALSASTFLHAEAAQEWNQEAALRVNGALDNFRVMQSQFGVRNGIRTAEAVSRSPLRLAAAGLAVGLAILVALAFVRAGIRANLADTESDRA